MNEKKEALRMEILKYIDSVSANVDVATKDTMVNALRLAGRFLAELPRACAPETTSDREGFIHPVECTGSAEQATVRLILRDFELAGLARTIKFTGNDAQKADLKAAVATLSGAVAEAKKALYRTLADN